MAGVFDFVLKEVKKSNSIKDKVEYIVTNSRNGNKGYKKSQEVLDSIDSDEDRFACGVYLLGDYAITSNISFAKLAESQIVSSSSQMNAQDIKRILERIVRDNPALLRRVSNIIWLLRDNRLRVIDAIANDPNSSLQDGLDNKNVVEAISQEYTDVEKRVELLKFFYEKFPKLGKDDYYYAKDPYMWALVHVDNIELIKTYALEFSDKYINKATAFAYILVDNYLNKAEKLELYRFFQKELNEAEFDLFNQIIVKVVSSAAVLLSYREVMPVEYIGLYFESNSTKSIIFSNTVAQSLDYFISRINEENSHAYSILIYRMLSSLTLMPNDYKALIDDKVIPLKDKLSEEDFQYLLSQVVTHYISTNNDITEKINKNKNQTAREDIVASIREYKDYLSFKSMNEILNNVAMGNKHNPTKMMQLSASNDLDYILANKDIIGIASLKINKGDFDNPRFQQFLWENVDIKPEERERFIQVAKYLTGINANIFKTLNVNLLTDKYLDMFEKVTDEGVTYPSLRVIGRYAELQDIILSFDDETLELFKILYKEIVNQNYDYTVLLKKVLDGFKERKIIPNAVKLFKDASEENKTRLVNSLIYILTKKTFQNLTKAEYLYQMEDFLMGKVWSQSFRTVVDAKNLLLMYKYGIDYYEAVSYCNRYAKALNADNKDLSPKDQKLVKILLQVKEILSCDNMEELKVMASLAIQTPCHLDYRFSSCLEAQIRKMYARVLNSRLAKVEDFKKSEESFGVKKGVYYAFDESRPEFNILLTALGAYNNFQRPDNYKDDWERPTDSVHAFCTSLISNQMMGTATQSFACLGFSEIPENNLLLAAPFDIGSSQANIQIDTALRMPDSRVEFMFPDEFIDHTRHTHNEMVIDRYSEDRKVSPSYSILMVERFDPSIVKRWRRGIFFQNEKEDYLKFDNAVQAANDFGIPLVIIERKKIKEYEKAAINQLINDFEKTYDVNLVSKILTRFENNRSGMRRYWNYEGFDIKDFKNILQRIYKITERLAIKDSKSAEEIYDSIINWINYELDEKVGRKGAVLGLYELCFIPSDLIDELENRKASLKYIAQSSEVDLLNAVYQMTNGLYGNRAKKRNYDGKSAGIIEIADYISDNKDRIEASLTDPSMKTAYPEFNTKIHGMNHIEDVILFTNLIAPRVLKDEGLIKVAIEAAKYHDSGRVNDGASEHALASAEKSLAILSKNQEFSKRDLAVIYTAICAHDAHAGKGLAEYIEKVFLDISKRIGNSDIGDIRDVYDVAIVLRDADALDRTRFRDESRAYLDEKRLSSVAKEYVDFSLRLSEYHALSRIEELIQNGIITQEQYEVMAQGKDAVQALSYIEHTLRHSEPRDERRKSNGRKSRK